MDNRNKKIERLTGYAESELHKSLPRCSEKERIYLEKVTIVKGNIGRSRNSWASTTINLCKNGKFLNSLFTNSFLNETALEKLRKTISKTAESYHKKEISWIKCEKGCAQYLKTLIKKEIRSTAYILRILANSVLTIDPNIKLVLIYDGEVLTGEWKQDYKHFKVEKMGNVPARLIMGFGPSASGKTFWAKNIIEIISSTDNSFPKAFLSVDGGLYRELSEIYQHIIKELSKFSQIAGFTNLVSASFIGPKSLFSSGKIKKAVKKFLAMGDNQEKLSIYVPETLGTCAKPWINCKKEYVDPYITITGDNKWIGLLIYQHKKGKQCSFDIGYKCKSTRESGKSREVSEGKKYSSGAYDTSMSKGKQMVKSAPGARIWIHNGGGKKVLGQIEKCEPKSRKVSGETDIFKGCAKSTIIEFPINGKLLLSNVNVEKYNAVYKSQNKGSLLSGGRRTKRHRKYKKKSTKKKGKKRKTRRRTKRKIRSRTRHRGGLTLFLKKKAIRLLAKEENWNIKDAGKVINHFYKNHTDTLKDAETMVRYELMRCPRIMSGDVESIENWNKRHHYHPC